MTVFTHPAEKKQNRSYIYLSCNSIWMCPVWQPSINGTGGVEGGLSCSIISQVHKRHSAAITPVFTVLACERSHISVVSVRFHHFHSSFFPPSCTSYTGQTKATTSQKAIIREKCKQIEMTPESFRFSSFEPSSEESKL